MKTQTLRLIAVIHKDEDTAYWVTAPDMPGCIACGDTINDAIVSFHQALELHIDGMLEDETPLPAPRSEKEILAVVETPPLQTVTVEIAVPARKSA